MRKLISGLAVLAALATPTLLTPSTGHADPYKYCSVTSYMGGTTNCGFTTYEQCMQTTRGMGGTCQVNQFYTGPDKDTAATKRKRKTNN